jgi:class 3 adenylate cyclase
MCIFGAPFMNEDDALRCVRCAVAMRRRFRELVRAIDGGSSAVELDVHIGVNTGTVVAGTVGSALRMEYTALGDTVNTAARLEGFARAGQILIGTTTAQLVREHVQLTSRGVVSLKGKSEAVEVFEVPDDEETSLTAPKAAGPM